MNPLNQELRDYRKLIEHYRIILKEDKLIREGKMESDGRPLLSEADKEKIVVKLNILEDERDKLLLKDNDYIN